MLQHSYGLLKVGSGITDLPVRVFSTRGKKKNGARKLRDTQKSAFCSYTVKMATWTVEPFRATSWKRPRSTATQGTRAPPFPAGLSPKAGLPGPTAPVPPPPKKKGWVWVWGAGPGRHRRPPRGRGAARARAPSAGGRRSRRRTAHPTPRHFGLRPCPERGGKGREGKGCAQLRPSLSHRAPHGSRPRCCPPPTARCSPL